MTDTYLPVLKAVIAKIKAASTAAGTRVFSDVPQKEIFPYVVVSIDSGDYSAKDFTGMEHTVQFNIYSRQKSPEQVGSIRSDIYDALNRQESTFTLDSGTMSNILFNGVGDVFKDTDGKTWLGVIQFRAVVT